MTGRGSKSGRSSTESGSTEKHHGEQGSPSECEKLAYLLCPRPEADMGQMQLHLPSSASSSPPGRNIHPGSGLEITGDGGGGVSPSKHSTLIQNFNSSLHRDKPGLPRCTARLQFTQYEDDKPNCTVLGEGNCGLAGNNNTTRGEHSNSRGNTSAREPATDQTGAQ